MRARRIFLWFLLLAAFFAGHIRTADAQFFEFFRGFLRPPAAMITPEQQSRDSSPSAETGVTSRSGYCVRTCDGAFFPLSKVEGRTTPEHLCNALCPQVETKVFFGGQIDTAMTKSGEAYSKLKTAFLYREKDVAQCDCTDRGGIAVIDITQDPTLKPGDIVVTEDGPKSFQGSANTPHKESEFRSVKMPSIKIAHPSRPSIQVHPRREISDAD